jgi:hypothetical protein
MTTIILHAEWVMPLMGRATNGLCHLSCHNGPPTSRAEPCRPMDRSGSPSMTRWLMPCQPWAMAPWVVSCLGQTKFHVQCADPFDPTRKYKTNFNQISFSFFTAISSHQFFHSSQLKSDFQEFCVCQMSARTPSDGSSQPTRRLPEHRRKSEWTATHLLEN